MQLSFKFLLVFVCEILVIKYIVEIEINLQNFQFQMIIINFNLHVGHKLLHLKVKMTSDYTIKTLITF